MCSCTFILSHEWKVSSFITKWIPDVRVNFWPPYWCTAVVHQHGGFINLYKVAWNPLTDNSEMMYRTDLKIGEVIYEFVSFDFRSFWLISWNSFDFFCCFLSGLPFIVVVYLVVLGSVVDCVNPSACVALKPWFATEHARSNKSKHRP